MKPTLRRVLHAAGTLLGILGVLFVAERIYQYAGEIDVNRISRMGWWLIASLSLIYAGANTFLAIAWRYILNFFGEYPSHHKAIRVYGLSQLAKYVPGNIFHLAGRQALGMAVGIPARALGLSAIWELGLITIAGTVFGILVFPLIWQELSIPESIILFSCAVFVLYLVVKYVFSAEFAIALLWQILFLVVSGAVFAAVFFIILLTDSDLPGPSIILGAFVVAWLAGLITPGTPAGMGVREAVILFLLSDYVEPLVLLFAVVLGRLVTVFGDLLFFAANATYYRAKN